MLPVYVVHYDKLVDRKEAILRGPFGGWAEFITSQHDDIKTYNIYDPNPTKWTERCEVVKSVIEPPPFRQLKLGDVACADKHIEALHKATYNRYASLIIEDDAIPINNLWNGIKELMNAFIEFQWDVAIVGGAFDHTITSTIGTLTDNILMKDHPATNTVCAYIIKPWKAQELAKALIKNKITLPIDFEYNHWFKELDFKVCHYVPYLFREGSSMGVFKGSQVR